MKDWIHLDGSAGEGGGQILRSALALSLATGRPLKIIKIRGGRKKPGLLRQHLTALKLAARIGLAEVEGAQLGSQTLTFVPQGIMPGVYEAAVGTAGSATLVVQTVLPALLLADGPSILRIGGGTHNPFAPPFDFLERVYLPALAKMGAQVTCSLKRAGFFPAGGGELVVHIEPIQEARPFEALERGAFLGREARILNAGLPKRIPDREERTLVEEGAWVTEDVSVEHLPNRWGPGNVVMLEARYEGGNELVTGFARRKVRAEEVAREAASALDAYEASGAPVGEHLADQLLLPMALLAGGHFLTQRPSLHTRTNAEVIQGVLPVDIQLRAQADGQVQISVLHRG